MCNRHLIWTDPQRPRDRHAGLRRVAKSNPSPWGHPVEFRLGGMYAIGEGVPEDTVNAYAWFSIAAAQGNTSAKELKELVAEHMSRAQIAAAQARAREYWTRYVVPFQ